MQLSVSHEFLPRSNSVRASQVMDHFGIDFEHGHHVIADNLELPIQPGQITLFTGPSGSGKSSLLRAAAAQLQSQSARVLHLDDLPLGDSLLIDALPMDGLDAMQLLAQCGLGEARLLLRRPSELSDGQRHRFRLALAIAREPQWLVADEFTATLDRTLARVIAFNLHRIAERTGIGVLLATTHEDIVADLAPHLHVQCRLDGSVHFVRSPETETAPATSTEPPPSKPRKKKESASLATSGSVKRPVATGRTSLGGITAAIPWP